MKHTSVLQFPLFQWFVNVVTNFWIFHIFQEGLLIISLAFIIFQLSWLDGYNTFFLMLCSSFVLQGSIWSESTSVGQRWKFGRWLCLWWWLWRYWKQNSSRQKCPFSCCHLLPCHCRNDCWWSEAKIWIVNDCQVQGCFTSLVCVAACLNSAAFNDEDKTGNVLLVQDVQCKNSTWNVCQPTACQLPK